MTARPTVPWATIDSPHLALKIEAERLIESRTVRSSMASTGTTKVVARPQATPKRRDVMTPASLKRSAMVCITRPTAMDSSVQDTMLPTFELAMAVASASLGSSPWRRRLAMTLTTTLQ